MGQATTLSTPQDQVESLIRQVAAENDLQITDQLVDLEPGRSTLVSEAESASAKKEDALTRRLVARVILADISCVSWVADMGSNANAWTDPLFAFEH